MNISLEKLIEITNLMTRDPYIHIITLIIILDVLTGYMKALVQHKLNSSVGLIGLCKHMLMIIILLIIYPYFMILGFKGIIYAIILFYIVTYSISLIENLTLIGIPVPNWIIRRLEKVKQQLDDYKGED